MQEADDGPNRPIATPADQRRGDGRRCSSKRARGRLDEGQERPLKQWDFVHCPPETRHAFVGAGDGPCVILAVSSRQFQKDGPWGFYCADETARRYNASSPEDTQDSDVAYARFPPSQPTRYRDGLLPD
jgi:hypothetical protein